MRVYGYTNVYSGLSSLNGLDIHKAAIYRNMPFSILNTENWDCKRTWD